VLRTVNIAAVTGEEIYRALELNWNDFEDAVQYTTGEHIQADYIITRDPSGYDDSSIPVIQPVDFLIGRTSSFHGKTGIYKKRPTSSIVDLP